MKKQVVRLNESQLKKVIKESVKKVLREGYEKVPTRHVHGVSHPTFHFDPDTLEMLRQPEDGAVYLKLNAYFDATAEYARDYDGGLSLYNWYPEDENEMPEYEIDDMYIVGDESTGFDEELAEAFIEKNESAVIEKIYDKVELD